MSKSLHTLSLLLSLLLTLAGCGSPVESTEEGEALVTLAGQMSLTPGAKVEGPLRLALAWYPQFGSGGGYSAPKTIFTEELTYAGEFPIDYRFHIYRPPPADALGPLEGLAGRGAVGVLLAYVDLNGNKKLDTIPDNGTPIDQVVASSMHGTTAAALILYLDSDQTALAGLKKGFNLTLTTQEETGVVPFSTPIPMEIKPTAALNLMVCERDWSLDPADPFRQVCGIDLQVDPVPAANLTVSGEVELKGRHARIDLTVVHDEQWVQDAQVTIAGRTIPYDSQKMGYALEEADTALLSEGSTLQLKVVSKGQTLTRPLALAEGFDITAPVAGSHAAKGASLQVAWTAAAGTRSYRAYLKQPGEAYPLRTAFIVGWLDWTFDAVDYVGEATLSVEAITEPPEQERLGNLEIKVTRELPLTFDP